MDIYKAFLIVAVLLALLATALCIAEWFRFVWHLCNISTPLLATEVMACSWVVVWGAKEMQ